MIERATMQFLVPIDAYSVQIEVIIFFFGHRHFQSYVIRYCKNLLQDFKLMQALVLYKAIARF